jgi:peptidyl-prolyl cis-trans isomerase D
MSIIQTIRDKGARIAVVLIALSLIGFILMDAFTGRSRLFDSGNSTVLGKVNGKEIDQREFAKKIAAQEQGQQLGEAGRQRLVDQLWNQEVNQALLKQEYNKLGIAVGQKELADMLYGAEPHQYAKRFFYGDENTTAYDRNQVQQMISQVQKGKNSEQKTQLNQFLDVLKNARLTDKYTNLVAGSIHYAKWLLEKQNVDNSLMAKISYVNIPYTVIPDSTKGLAVTDKEIADYIEKHKDRYKVEEETRTIEYVLFSAVPSPADSAAAFKQVHDLKEPFAATDTSKIETFLTRNGSVMSFFDGFIGKSQIQVVAKDSIFREPNNAVYGPYLDGGNYVLAKMIGTMTLPDSVYCRHILIKTSGDGALPDSIAERRIDSAIDAINKGANFVTVMKQVSMDQAANTQDSTGLMRFTSQEIQDKERFDQDFGKYILFEGKKGQRKKVKTKFGFHYIEIADQINIEPHYKVAYMAKRIDASDETEQGAENAAMQFAGESRDQKSFEAYYEKNLKPKGLQKYFSPPLGEHSYEINGVGVSRAFVRKVFEADRGDVLQPERIGDNYVVAVVADVNETGTMSVANARSSAEPAIRNKKKAELIRKKLGNFNTLEEVSTLMGVPIQTLDSVRFSSQENRPLSFETKVLGATANPANNGKVVKEVLESRYGSVYVIRVDNVTTTPLENADITAQRKSLEMRGRMNILFSSQFAQYGQQQYDPAAVLKKAAKIKDYRTKFNY